MTEPIFKEEYWICPKCKWKNPYPDKIICTYPATICYRCYNCDFHYDERGRLSEAEQFRLQFPRGKE